MSRCSGSNRVSTRLWLMFTVTSRQTPTGSECWPLLRSLRHAVQSIPVSILSSRLFSTETCLVSLDMTPKPKQIN